MFSHLNGCTHNLWCFRALTTRKSLKSFGVRTVTIIMAEPLAVVTIWTAFSSYCVMIGVSSGLHFDICL